MQYGIIRMIWLQVQIESTLHCTKPLNVGNAG